MTSIQVVPYPTKTWAGQLKWTDAEDQKIRELYPDYMTTLEQIQKWMPWRTVKAISTRAARIKIHKQYPEEYL